MELLSLGESKKTSSLSTQGQEVSENDFYLRVKLGE